MCAVLESRYETSNVLKSNKKNLLDYSMELVIKRKREIHTLLSQFFIWLLLHQGFIEQEFFEKTAYLISSYSFRPWIDSSLHTVENPGSRKFRFCTKVQSSQICKILGVFQNQKMDIISCHDCQFVSCQNQIIRLTWFDFKYKKVHIHGIWDNENECN